MRCGRCGHVSPVDASTDMQTKLADAPRMRELGVGADLEVTPERARVADYLTIAEPVPGAPVIVLQAWLCPSCDATGWAEITIDGGRISGIEAVALTDGRFDRSHYILEEDARLEAARVTGRDSGEMWGPPVIDILRRRGSCVGSAAHRILKRIGGGRYADVFLAERDGAEVVLKVALDEPRDDPYATNAIFFARGRAFHTGTVGEWTPDPRFVLEREAALLSRVRHPAMVKLVDHGEGWLALERIEGPTFREGFARMDASAVRAVARLLEEMSGELPLHGDVKPENVMWDARGAIRILDPAAGAMESIGPQPLRMLVTPVYNPLLLPSDRPALGIMLLEALLRRHPLVHAHPVAPPERWSAETRERLALRLGGAQGASLLERILLPSDLDPATPRVVEDLALTWLGLGRKDP